MTTEIKRKPMLSVALPEDLAEYLREKAKTGYRSLTAEIGMRLEESRKLEQKQAQGAQA